VTETRGRAGWTTQRAPGLGPRLVHLNLEPEPRKQDWFLMCLKGGRSQLLTACGDTLLLLSSKVRVGVGVRVRVRTQGDKGIPLAPPHRIAGHLRGCREPHRRGDTSPLRACLTPLPTASPLVSLVRATRAPQWGPRIGVPHLGGGALKSPGPTRCGLQNQRATVAESALLAARHGA
jgi:hypothetical protein